MHDNDSICNAYCNPNHKTYLHGLFDTVHRAIHKLQLQKYQYENNALNVKLYTNKHERNDNLAIKAFVCFLVWFSSIFEFRLE